MLKASNEAKFTWCLTHGLREGAERKQNIGDGMRNSADGVRKISSCGPEAMHSNVDMIRNSAKGVRDSEYEMCTSIDGISNITDGMRKTMRKDKTCKDAKVPTACAEHLPPNANVQKACAVVLITSTVMLTVCKIVPKKFAIVFLACAVKRNPRSAHVIAIMLSMMLRMRCCKAQ